MTPTVFAGAPAVLSERQRAELDRWLTAFRALGLDVVRLDRESYTADPWAALTMLLQRVDAVVLFGFAQLCVRDGTWRPDTPEATPAATRWTTPWLQIEAGMAVAGGRPVLVLAEPGVAEGAFHSDVDAGPVSAVSMDRDTDDPAVLRWRAAF